MRRAAKIDNNQRQIVSDLRSIGASVQSLAREGGGCPDIVVGYRGYNYLLEIKDPTVNKNANANANGLYPEQEAWHNAWQGSVAVVRSTDEALAAIGAKRCA